MFQVAIFMPSSLAGAVQTLFIARRRLRGGTGARNLPEQHTARLRNLLGRTGGR